MTDLGIGRGLSYEALERWFVEAQSYRLPAVRYSPFAEDTALIFRLPDRSVVAEVFPERLRLVATAAGIREAEPDDFFRALERWAEAWQLRERKME